MRRKFSTNFETWFVDARIIQNRRTLNDWHDILLFNMLLAIHGAFHVDPTPEIFFRILLLRHDKANLEMLWPSHTSKLS